MKRIALILVAAACLLTAGCGAVDSTRFPYGASKDRHNFHSTWETPYNLALVDRVTGETVWALEVPVGKMAVVDLEHTQDWTPSLYGANPAHSIRWGLFDPNMPVGVLLKQQDLSGRPVALKVTLRDERLATAPGSAYQPAARQAPQMRQVREPMAPLPRPAGVRPDNRGLRPLLDRPGAAAPAAPQPRAIPPTEPKSEGKSEAKSTDSAETEPAAETGEDLDLGAPEPVEPDVGPQE
jgi:hypothetical protein